MEEEEHEAKKVKFIQLQGIYNHGMSPAKIKV